jgi:flagellar protein FlgJ
MSPSLSGALPTAALVQQQVAEANQTLPAFDKRARESAQDFESVFLSSMFQHMYAGVNGSGPFGGGPAAGVWRSFLTDQYAKSIAKAGGIGIAKDVYRTLLEHQAGAQAQPAPRRAGG